MQTANSSDVKTNVLQMDFTAVLKGLLTSEYGGKLTGEEAQYAVDHSDD